MPARPADISVIVPVGPRPEGFAECLDALLRLQPRPLEILLVLDGLSSLPTAPPLPDFVRVVHHEPRSGPAVARNVGAERAAGGKLFFLDADVRAPADLLARAAASLETHPECAAVFGSYDDHPAAPGPVSRYRNLLHHYVHQHANPDAMTFWAGCGLIRKEVFLALGGFSTRYPRPMIEDVELGYRLVDAGHAIRLEKSLQVTHLKAWRLPQLLRDDILRRAWPWSLLMLQRGRMPRDLNLKSSARWSAGCWWAALLAAPWSQPAALPFLLAALLLNIDFYRFLARRGGPGLLLAGLPLHGLYFLYSSATFAAARAWWMVRGRKQGFASDRDPSLSSGSEPS